MDLIKQYIVQSITTAAGNLRMNNQRMEVIAMLKDVILKSKDIPQDLNRMKKITELSKLAIKLNDMHHHLLEGQIDFLKVSDKFKEHSFNLIKEINHVLDMVNPYTFRETIDRLIEQEKKVVEIIVESENAVVVKSDASLSSQNIGTDDNTKLAQNDKGWNAAIDEDKDGNEMIGEMKAYNRFEAAILKPIKAVDDLLNQINLDSDMPEDIEEHSKLMKANAELSFQNGFNILAEMHEIISLGLTFLKNKELIPSKEVIESLRACLIVIAAVVRSKEVDIKNYLNRAEVFGKFLQKIKIEEIK